MDYAKASKEEQMNLVLEKSVDELKEIYRPLVEKVVKKYDSSIPEKLVQKGLEAIEIASEKFVAGMPKTCDFKFSAYATWWIKTWIEKELGIFDEAGERKKLEEG